MKPKRSEVGTWKVNESKVDSGKTTTIDVIQIGDVNVVAKDICKGPMVLAIRSALLSRNLSWQMIMKLAAIV